MFFMDKKKILKKLLPTMAMFIAAAAIGVTGATVLHSLTLENPIKTPGVEGGIEEDLSTKKVEFTNNGEADVLIRASFTESWTGKNEDEETVILPNLGSITDTDKQAEPAINLAYWEKGSDGWYYYKKVLPGSVAKSLNDGLSLVSEPFINRVSFKTSSELYAPYKDAEYQLHVTMEVVQASDVMSLSQDAAEKLFGVRPTMDPTTWGTDKYTCPIRWFSQGGN